MSPKIQSFKHVIPMIYAYNTPGVVYNDGWTKIGYTERQTVAERINQQTHTAGIKPVLAWQDNAMYKDGSGEYFTDHDFHAYLETEAHSERRVGTEWFHLNGIDSQRFFNLFASRKGANPKEEHLTYALREEQENAVSMTAAYFEKGGEEFLWNAKPRFGKTLTAYDLVRRMGFINVLIVTNRPSIANSWADDFRKFIGWQTGYKFVSENEALADRVDVMTRESYVNYVLSLPEDEECGMIAFESLQGLKGSVHLGSGNYDKLKWIKDCDFDLLIVDESQEGVDTIRTDRVFNNITRKHTLYLSGTPFKQLAGEQFSDEQIFNWSYADEQEMKDKWQGEDYNPYEALPRLEMYTYQLSPMIRERIEKGLDLSDEDGEVDYAFDLNEFFATNESGKFIHEEEIKKFLKALTTQEKYPFSTPELRSELKHTMWYLNRVASAKALAELLKKDEVFGEYNIVLAAGDGKLDDDDAAEVALSRVKKAIATYDKTITLTVGQLTVGITVPEWSGVLMLCNLKSPSSYMQAAFRAQNPCIMTDGGKRYRKQTAYVFDFDPARTLIIFDEFANNLLKKTANGGGSSDDRQENIKRLLNFFPVLGEDDEGKMVELNAAQVLSIPRKLKSQEVVRRGFMCNFLFQNISNIFGAPSIVREIVEKLTPAQEEGGKGDKKPLDGMDNIPVGKDGEVDIPNEIVIGKSVDLFGDKIYETIPADIEDSISAVGTSEDFTALKTQTQTLANAVINKLKEEVIAPAASEYEVKKGVQNRMEKQTVQEVEGRLDKIRTDYEQQAKIAKAELEKKRAEAETQHQVEQAEKDYNDVIEQALKAFNDSARQSVQEIMQNKPKEVVEQLERNKAEQEKHSIEDKIRAHLRGFSRTIPSFIMAYGDENLKLSNFDEYTEDDVFWEVTGISEDDFRFLRDGGDRVETETGELKHFDGHLFDEVVFNDSVAEFLKKKEMLSDYFDESHDEDIFDYIPPQKTNQIFTPRWVVEKMVDMLEENNPGCFDDPDKTFADLYMKSGLYITEIVKRLYRSEKIKSAYPDDKERIRHILRKQVFGMAPTRIIYLIATNYILGFDPELKAETQNFVQADAARAAKSGTLQSLVDKYFGNRTE